jgi:hypothetical protein
MSNYVKFWTDALHDTWVKTLTLPERGAWAWMILLAKKRGDSGHLVFGSWRDMRETFRCDERTIKRIVLKFARDGKINFTTSDSKTRRVLQVGQINGAVKCSSTPIIIELRNYQYWQRDRRPEDSRNVKPNLPDPAVECQQNTAYKHTLYKRVDKEGAPPPLEGAAGAAPKKEPPKPFRASDYFPETDGDR